MSSISRNSKVLSPGVHYRSQLNGWESYDNVGTGVPAAAAEAPMDFARSLRFSCSANVVDPQSLSAACRRRVASLENRVVTSIPELRGTGFEGDGAFRLQTDLQVVCHCKG
jgi:hypothetical protein